jgi:hypothetical protein
VHTYTPTDGTFTVINYGSGSLSAFLALPSGYWRLEFASGTGNPLTVGEYSPAIADLSTRFVVLRISNGWSCSSLTGRFVVREATYAADGSVLRFAADAEQHCNDGGPATFAAIRYNSTISDMLPFAGDYPKYGLSVTAPDHGVVTGTDIACGGGQSSCTVSFGNATSVALTATPDSGYIFTGWTESCSGSELTTVYVNSIKRCGATFSPVVPDAPRVLGVISTVDPDGTLLRKRIYSSPLNSSWVVGAHDGRWIDVSIEKAEGSRNVWWDLRLAAPTGQTLDVGTYTVGGYTPDEGTPWLYLWTDSGGCGITEGRFVIHDLELAGDEVVRLVADVELHCGVPSPNYFISIRYNSLSSDVEPFGGTYPQYKLVVEPSAHGTVTGPSLACGTSGSACELMFAQPTDVTLTATPDSGYIFTGWTGFCARGRATTTVRADMLKECRATFAPVVADSPRTLLTIDSMPGDYIGQAFKGAYSTETSVWSVSTPDGEGRHVRARVQTGQDDYWDINLSGPGDEVLSVGTYEPAFRHPFVLFGPGLSVTTLGRGCNELTGRFVIYDIAVIDGEVVRLAADIEQHCENYTAALFMAIRYNTTVSYLPFGGVYPRYELTVTAPVHGSVSGSGIACGGGATICAVSFGGAQNVTLTATPEPGYVFMGWMGACNGGQTMTIIINSPRTCGAVFHPVIPTGPRTRLALNPATGHYVAGPDNLVYSLANSRWIVFALGGGRSIHVTVYAPDDRSEVHWYFDFSAPAGSVLQPGVYEIPDSTYSPATPYLGFYGDGRGCTGVGRFVIRQLELNPATGVVYAFAVDFEHHCYSLDSPAAIGSLQYQSTVDIVTHPSSGDLNADGKLDFWWQHETGGWIAAWYMSGSFLKEARLASIERVADTAWKIVGSADFNGDTKPDLLWRHEKTGVLTVWYMDGTTYLGPGIVTPSAPSDLDWEVRSIADLNRDGHPDLIWQHRSQGYLAVWLMEGVRLVEARLLTPDRVGDLNWKIIGAGDFNGDGKPDLFWRHQQTGLMTVWYMDGLSFAGAGLLDLNTVSDLNWQIGAIGDINDDGKPDLVWQNRATGRFSVWIMDGVHFSSDQPLVPAQVSDTNWRLVGPR